jgi:3-dehydroquinate synthase
MFADITNENFLTAGEYVPVKRTAVAATSVLAQNLSSMDILENQCNEVIREVLIMEKENLTLKNVLDILSETSIRTLLLNIIGWVDFEIDVGTHVKHVDVIAAVKVLRYTFNLPMGYLINHFVDLLKVFSDEDLSSWDDLVDFVMENHAEEKFRIALKDHEMARSLYEEPCKKFEDLDPQLVHPTSIYKTNSGRCYSCTDSSKIEAFLETQQTASIRIKAHVLDLGNTYLRNIYKPLGRCVMVIDEHVDGLWGEELETYFEYYKVPLVKLCYRAHEADKNIASVQTILEDYKRNNVNRNQPVLVVGGGVITDLAGFACGLYHRGTPYIMLCTSIVSGIDAGPSPRTCCDGMGYKNLFGAFHPPVITITDRGFFFNVKTRMDTSRNCGNCENGSYKRC